MSDVTLPIGVNPGETRMKKYEFKGNGETFYSEEQSVGAAILLRAAFAGKPIGEDPDKTG